LKICEVADTCPLKHSEDVPKRDLNQIAASIVEKTTQNYSQDDSGKNPAAVALGRLGGLKGGRARNLALSKRRKSQIAKQAAAARWKKRKKA
jgi:hypothetical protein